MSQPVKDAPPARSLRVQGLICRSWDFDGSRTQPRQSSFGLFVELDKFFREHVVRHLREVLRFPRWDTSSLKEELVGDDSKHDIFWDTVVTGPLPTSTQEVSHYTPASLRETQRIHRGGGLTVVRHAGAS